MADDRAGGSSSATREPDAETAGLLARMAASEQPPIWTLDAAAARALYDPMTAASAHEAEHVERIEETEIAPGLDARFYWPLPVNSQLPLLLFFHGGGGVLGNLATHDAMCRTLAKAGEVIVVAIAYRLGPEHRFPAAFEDAWFAYESLHRAPAPPGADTGCIAVGGDSAGAGLAAAITQHAMVLGHAGPAFQLLLCPSLDATRDTRGYGSFADNCEGYFMTRDLLDWFLANYIRSDEQRKDPRLSPLLGVLRGRPPATLVATAGFDPLRDEGKAYADALSAAGGDITYWNYEHTIHDFFSFGRFLSFAAPALRECAAIMREALKNYRHTDIAR